MAFFSPNLDQSRAAADAAIKRKQRQQGAAGTAGGRLGDPSGTGARSKGPTYTPEQLKDRVDVRNAPVSYVGREYFGAGSDGQQVVKSPRQEYVDRITARYNAESDAATRQQAEIDQGIFERQVDKLNQELARPIRGSDQREIALAVVNRKTINAQLKNLLAVREDERLGRTASETARLEQERLGLEGRKAEDERTYRGEDIATRREQIKATERLGIEEGATRKQIAAGQLASAERIARSEDLTRRALGQLTARTQTGIAELGAEVDREKIEFEKAHYERADALGAKIAEATEKKDTRQLDLLEAEGKRAASEFAKRFGLDEKIFKLDKYLKLGEYARGKALIDAQVKQILAQAGSEEERKRLLGSQADEAEAEYEQNEARGGLFGGRSVREQKTDLDLESARLDVEGKKQNNDLARRGFELKERETELINQYRQADTEQKRQEAEQRLGQFYARTALQEEGLDVQKERNAISRDRVTVQNQATNERLDQTARRDQNTEQYRQSTLENQDERLDATNRRDRETAQLRQQRLVVDINERIQEVLGSFELGEGQKRLSLAEYVRALPGNEELPQQAIDEAVERMIRGQGIGNIYFGE